MAVNKRLLQGAAAAGPLTPSENFNVVTYTGNGSTQSITGVGFKPDIIWIKDRSAARDHNLTDSTRGVTHPIYIEANPQLTNSTFVTSFDTDGFTLGNNATANENGEDFVAWCWKANGGTTSSNTDGTITSTVQTNTAAGFSIIKYTGNGSSGATIGHNLGVVPDMFIVKRYTGSGTWNWRVYHKDMDSSSPENYNMALNSSSARFDRTEWNDTAPTSTVFSVNDHGSVNENGIDYICYAFADIDGFSSFGSYVGNGSTDGPIVETGFEPAMIIIKRTDSIEDWKIIDNKRGFANTLEPNEAIAEETGNNSNFLALSNGFQIGDTNGDFNANGGTYIYMAFAADPDTEAPTLADSFAVETYTGDGTSNRQINTLGFKPGLFWQKTRATSSSCTYNNLFDIVRGGNKTLYSNVTSAEVTNQGCGYIQSFDDYGVTYTGDSSGINNSGENFVIWAWKADDNEPTIEGGAAKAVYKFEDNANDVTGDFNGTASNVSYSSSGKFNKAADFSTGGANIAIGSPIPNTDTAVSVSAWIYLNTNATSYETVIGAGSATASSEAPFRVNVRYVSANTYKIEGLRQIGGTYYNTALSNYTDSSMAVETWHHIVWTYHPTGRTLTTYLNGSKVDTLSMGSSGSSVNDSTSVIGNFRNDTTADNFSGLIDQVRIYSGTLQDEQVSQLYAETASDNDDLFLGGTPETIISANANAGFSIVKSTVVNDPGDYPHGLSSAPEMIIVKRTDGSGGWQTYHTSVGTGNRLELNSDAAVAGGVWNNTAPTATAFTYDGLSAGEDFVAYCWHSVSGFSSIGGYTGSGSSGNAQNIGFQPDFVMIKSKAQYNWNIYDSKRPSGSITGRYMLLANADDGEYTTSAVHIDLTSTGFSFPNGYDGTNKSSQDYVYMAFKMNKTIYPTSGNMSFLVIAGGGGAGGSDGGGGGAGGLRTSYRPTSGGGSSSESDITLAAGTYTITVGAAGTGGTGYSTTTPTSGADSSIAASGLTTITSTGGGRGGMYNHINGYPESGGSGGGAGGETGMVGFSGTANQGFDGEDGGGAGGTYHGGGGGGAAEAGGTDAAGQGGDGLSVSITGSAVTYAGGGAGGGLSGTTQGGAGGGGNSGVGSGDVNGSAGSTNTGSGGGAGADGSSSQGGAGGSGVVILRLLTSEYSGSTTGSPTVTTDGDYTIIKYTGSGTYVHS